MIKKISIGALIGVFALIVLMFGLEIYSKISALGSLDDVPAQYSYGPADADLSVVEFVKYTCPYCRDVHDTIMEAVERDGNVLYVPRVLPTVGLKDAQMSYAAGKQGLFKLAHGALLKDPRIMEEDGLMSIADTLGFDQVQLEKDMQDDEIIDQINDNITLFHAVGAKATPTFVIGGDIIYTPEDRMPSVEDFLAMFEEARQ
ncbi:thioredoxin domain-containing protein [Alphaproteobacteria bacterium]|nr:thioredoxin domain-containing protein [Alphaproteobacteria bacterium]